MAGKGEQTMSLKQPSMTLWLHDHVERALTTWMSLVQDHTRLTLGSAMLQVSIRASDCTALCKPSSQSLPSATKDIRGFMLFGLLDRHGIKSVLATTALPPSTVKFYIHM